MPKQDVLVGLDIGTTKICAIVGEVDENNELKIIGIGSHPSRGLKKGVVTNIETTVGSISKAIEEAELMAGCEITRVYTGIAGNHIKSFNSTGVVAVKDREVTQEDIERVIDAAKAVAVPMDREIIHVIPQEYIIDEQDGITEPLGMCGVRLESKVHIVTAAVSSAQNIIKCANKAGLSVSDLVLQPIASAEAVLNSDEKELGCLLIDVGGGTSDFAIFSGGALIHTGSVAVGGDHITNDIAVGLRTPQHEAEKLKVAHGSAIASMVSPEDLIEVPSLAGHKARSVSKHLLSEIIEPRVEEIFTLVRNEVAESGYENLLAGGVIITGGSCLMPGMIEMAEFVFEMPIKLGVPQGISGVKDAVSSPKYATGVGLVQYWAKNEGIRHSGYMRGENEFFESVRARFSDFFGRWF